MDASAPLEAIRAYGHRHRERLATPGLALAVTDREGCLGVVLDGFANVDSREPVAPHHRFQIGSISKGFTALAILQQVEEGRLDLHAPVTEFLPWFEVRSAFEPITLHHLLSHTSGIVTGMESTLDAVPEVWSLRETETGFAPGERFHYSNVGYKALGLVLEEVTGRPWWESVRDRVLGPIGMQADVIITDAVRERLAVGYTSPYSHRPWLPRHGWAPSPWSESATADGTICATAEELTVYARLLLNAGAGVVSKASFERMTERVAVDPSTPGHVYGYGVRWVDGRWLGHSGGMVGFTASLLVDIESGSGVAFLMNSAFGRRLELIRFALACLAAEARGEPPPEVPDPASQPGFADADAFTGTFTDERGRVDVVAEPPGLVVSAEGRHARLIPIDEARDAFVVDDPVLERFPIRFLRGAGLVTGAFWGPRWLRRPGSAGPNELAAPHAWSRYPGRYVSWNPWAPGFDVFLRGDGLWLAPASAGVEAGGELRLTALDEGIFRAGETWSPDRVRFDVVVQSRAQRATFDGAPFYRTSVP